MFKAMLMIILSESVFSDRSDRPTAVNRTCTTYVAGNYKNNNRIILKKSC